MNLPEAPGKKTAEPAALPEEIPAQLLGRGEPEYLDYSGKPGEPIVVEVSGVMGCGKTTFVEALQKKLAEKGYIVFVSAELSEEASSRIEFVYSEENPATKLLFQAFMNGGRGLGFLETLSSAKACAAELPERKVVLLLDQGHWAQAAYAEQVINSLGTGKLLRKALKDVTSYLSIAETFLPVPSLRVFLECSPALCLERILTRGRPGEAEVVELAHLTQLYGAFSRKFEMVRVTNPAGRRIIMPPSWGRKEVKITVEQIAQFWD